MTVQTLAHRAFAPVRSLARRLAGCTRGMAAIEFGMVGPIMVFLFIGSVEFSQAITVNRRVTQVAASTADLVSRQSTVTAAQLNGYAQIVSSLMTPYSSTALHLKLVSVYAATADATGASPKVCWSYDYTGGNSTGSAPGSYAVNSAYSGLPTGILTGGTSVIVAEVNYQYVGPIFNLFLGTAGIPYAEKFYLKPRLSTEVVFAAVHAACII